VIAVVVTLVLLLVGVRVFSGGGSTGTPTTSPTMSSAAPTASTTSTPALTSTPSGTPTADAGPDLGQRTFDSGMDAYIGDVLNSQNTSVLAQGGTFTDPVYVRHAETMLDEFLSPDEAVGTMSEMFTPGDQDPWDLALPDSTLEIYRGGRYADYFPEGAIVARSADGHVFSFIGAGSTVTAMLMADSEDLLN